MAELLLNDVINPLESPGGLITRTKLSDSWRTRAGEIRATADIFRNAASRDRMLKVAEDFERMALKVRDRELMVGTDIK